MSFIRTLVVTRKVPLLRRPQEGTAFLLSSAAPTAFQSLVHNDRDLGFEKLSGNVSSRLQSGYSVRNFSTTSLPVDTKEGNYNEISLTAEQRSVMKKCQELHASIMPLNERLRGPLDPQSDRGTALPFVFLLGNHSSGKSSFINYLTGRQVQTTGVAPTDDAFTILAPGPVDADQDGPSIAGDPDLGFSPLRQFGPTLLHHTVLKIRSDLNCNFILGT
jgi:hypothetical protein